MKQLSDALKTSLAACETVCTLVKITLLGGRAVALADHDADVSVAGVVYASSYAFEVSSVAIASGTQNSSLELSLLMDPAICTRDDIRNGSFDRAKVEVMLVDYAHTGNGAGLYYAGRVQQITFADDISAVLQVASLLDQNVQCASEQYSYTCTADLGDARCKVDLSGRRKAFVVGAVASRQSFTTDLTDADAAWNGGLVSFTSGPNEGFAVEVGAYAKSGGGLVLKLPFPYALAAGDTGYVFPGCDKTPATCAKVYGNILNYRGVPIGNDPALAGSTSALATSEALPANQQPPGKVGYYNAKTGVFQWLAASALPAIPGDATQHDVVDGKFGYWRRTHVVQYPTRDNTDSSLESTGFNTFDPFNNKIGTGTIVTYYSGYGNLANVDGAVAYGAPFNFFGYVDFFQVTTGGFGAV